MVLQFIMLATAWNILGGYAGYVNFGSGAFFAVGAYTAVSLYKAFALPLGLQILAGAATRGLLGLGVGLLTLRLRGIFFSIATIAVTIILETVVLNWPYVGGAKGLPILRPDRDRRCSAATRSVAVLRHGGDRRGRRSRVARYIETSWIGRGLRAIRDNEGAAECSGVPTLKLKLARGDALRRADGRGGRALRAMLGRSSSRARPSA